MIVRFEEARSAPRADANSVAALQAHAERSQSGFREYARVSDAVEIERSFWITNAMLVELNASEVAPGQLTRLQNVRRVHANFAVQALDADRTELAPETSVPFDEIAAASHGGGAPYNGTYGVHVVNATQVWGEFGTRGEGVNVTVLDTGVNASHPDIDLSGWARIDSTGGITNTSVANASDHDGHGTHVSGTVAGGNASGQYIGVAPNATLNVGQVLGPGGGTFAQVTAGMEWAVNGTDGSGGEFSDVISMSLGAPGYTSAFIPHVRNVREQGIPLFVATGNEGEWRSGSPGNVYESISVGAVDSTLQVASFSNGEPIDVSEVWGSDAPTDWPEEYTIPEVSAPGVGILSASASDGGYHRLQGTSMATPHVSGVAALVLAANGSLTDDKVETTLEETAFDPYDYEDPDHRYGHGIVDALNATARATADTTVSGWVTNGTGAGVANATVRTEYGLQTRTNATGHYELDVPSTEQNLTADPIGYASNRTTIDGVGTAAIEQNVTVGGATVEAALIDGVPLYSNVSDGVELTYRVANVGNYSLDLQGGTYADASEATVTIDGTTVNFGENVTIGADGQTTVTVSVNPQSGFFGEVGLDHTFYERGGPGTVTTTTSATMVHDDPVSIPQDVDPSTLQTPVDAVYRNTTLALDSGTYVESNFVAATGGDATPLLLDRAVSVVAQEGATPTIAADYENYPGYRESAIYVATTDVRIEGVEVDGGSLDYAVVGANDGLTVAGAEIHNATDGVHLSAGVTDAVRNTTLYDLEYGIYARAATGQSGDVRIIANNTAWGIGTDAINVSPTSSRTSIRNNSFTLDAGANTAIRFESDVDRIAGNRITLNGSDTDGIVASPSAWYDPVTIADNRITGGGYGIRAENVETVRNNAVANATTGIDVTDLGSPVLVADNEVRNSTIGVADWWSTGSVYRNNTIDGIDQAGIQFVGTASAPVRNLTLVDNTVTNVGRTSDAPAISLVEARNVTIDGTTVSDGGILLYNASDVTSRDGSFANASYGLRLQANASDLRFEGGQFTDVDRVLWVNATAVDLVHNVTFANATATTATGAVRFEDAPPSAVVARNLSLADGTVVNAAGHNASLELGTDPGDPYPGNRTDVGTFLNVTEVGSSPTAAINVSYADAAVSGVREDTLAMYRANGSGWERVSTTGVDVAANDVWAELTRVGTVAPLAEQAGANLTVTNVESNTPVLEGETLRVNATITNTGTATDTQTVQLDVDGGVGADLDNETVSLDPGNATTIALNWTPGQGAAGDYTATVATNDDSNQMAVRVDAPATFSVAIDDTNSPVVTGEELTVTATINNTGDVRGNQTVELGSAALSGMSVISTEDTQTLALNASEQRTITFNWSTTEADAGDWAAVVLSANDSAQRNVTILEPANFSVGIDDTNSPVAENDTLSVNATIDNVGGVHGTQTVNLTIDGTEVDNQSVSLDAGATTTQAFEWTTGPGDDGNHTAAVNSENASATAAVEVLAPANVSVNLTGTNSPVAEGETLQVDATVNNTGDVTATRNVTLAINGTGVVASQTVTLAGGNASALALNWTPGGRDAGNYTVTVAAEDANDTAAVEIENASIYFEVETISAPATITAGDSYTLTANVSNVGAVNATQNVSYLLGGTVRATETNVSLNTSETTQLTFSATNDTPGDYAQAIRTANETVATTNLTVEAASSGGGGGGGGGGGFFLPPPSDDGGPSFSITSVDLGSSEVGVGESVAVDVRVDNDGDADGEYTATLTADGQQVDSETLSVNANWHATTTLTTSFDAPGTYQLAVDGQSAGTVEVTGEPALSITDVEVGSRTLADGETLAVTTTVANDGTVEGSMTVPLLIDGEVVDRREVTVGAGQTATVTFEHAVSGAGSRSLSVGEQAAGSVDVQSADGDGTGDGGTDGSADGSSGDGGGGLGGIVPVAVVAALLVLGSLGYVYSDRLRELLGR